MERLNNKQRAQAQRVAPTTSTQKILMVMYLLSGGRIRPVQFGDLVVEVFGLFPKDFCLVGHGEYPDAELIRRPIYKLRAEGLVNAGNKVFSLTQRGIDSAAQLVGSKSDGLGKDIGKPPRFVQKEVQRIQTNEGFLLFATGHKSKITENDFYNFLGVTSRTPRSDFLGRMSTLSEVMQAIETTGFFSGTGRLIVAYDRFLLRKFKPIIVGLSKTQT